MKNYFLDQKIDFFVKNPHFSHKFFIKKPYFIIYMFSIVYTVSPMLRQHFSWKNDFLAPKMEFFVKNVSFLYPTNLQKNNVQNLDINYFHCKEIVDILKETEKDSKNIFGFYSSQRMKDWQVGWSQKRSKFESKFRKL